MDKSKLYIRMCQEAKELQKLRTDSLWQDGDFYTDDIQKKRDIISAWTDREDMPYKMYHPVWLPRQDQLQEMVSRVFDCHLISDFNEWLEVANECVPIGKDTYRSKMLDYSMEQLWLAFVMKEKYNKIWNKEEWRKE